MRLPHDQQFHFPDGTSAASLDELRDKIETISYDAFYHHVDHSNNDFANWVRYILKDERLADEMEKVDSIVETVEMLNDYLQPTAAKAHFDAQDDMQSKIEKEIGFEPAPPSEPAPVFEEEPAPVEPFEETKPIEHQKPEEPASEPEFDIDTIRQRAGIDQTPTEADQSQDILVQEPTSSHVSTHLRREQGEATEIESFHHDMSRLIVKDFVWGMFFGLLIGFFLARMLGI